MMKVIKALNQTDYWHGEQAIGSFFSDRELRGYYNDLRKKVIIKSCELIVPQVIVSGVSYTHPVTVCQVGLGCFDKYIETNDHKFFLFSKKCADWLINNCIECSKNGGIFWQVPYSFKLFKQKSHFKSGLIQGQAISLLLRIHKINKNSIYLNSALSACKIMLMNRNDGGCYNPELNIIEEYPIKNQNSFVLNGAISAAWSVFDLFLATKDDNYREIFYSQARSIAANLHLFNNFGYSNYALYDSIFFGKISSPYYHKEHIMQLNVMYKLTEFDMFKKYKEIWELNSHSLFHKTRSYLIKSIFVIVQKIMRLR